MVIGHFAVLPHWIWQFIFSFHMPLFFIVAGYLYKPKELKESLRKDFRHLMVPYFLTCAVLVLLHLVYSRVSGSLEMTRYYLIATFVGAGSSKDCALLGDLPSIGAIWFLPALLVCKNVYSLLNPDRRLLFSSIIFIVATLVGTYLISLPFSVLSGLSGIIFYAIGDRLKGVSEIKAPYWIAGGVCWVLSLCFSVVLLVIPRMDLYFIDVAGATFATILVYILSMWLNKRSEIISSAFSWLGRNTLPILCFHLLELNCGLSHHLNITGSPLIDNLLRLIIPIILTVLFNVFINRTSIRAQRA